MTTPAWAALAVVAIGVIVALVQIAAIRKRLAAIPESDDDMVAMLLRIDNEVGTLFANATDIDARVSDLEAAAPAMLLQSGVARYDGFPGMVGSLSRSVAVIDGTGTGFVLTVLINRDESRFFLKGVVEGEGSEPLSPEELAAIKSARRS
jgi:hypothetical protein